SERLCYCVNFLVFCVCLFLPFFFFLILRPPGSTLFPYTTLFRSGCTAWSASRAGRSPWASAPTAWLESRWRRSSGKSPASPASWRMQERGSPISRERSPGWWTRKRSEERRVGKESRAGWLSHLSRKKRNKAEITNNSSKQESTSHDLKTKIEPRS